MENTAKQALSWLRNQMSGSDLRQLSMEELYQLESICQHWQAMALAERKVRADAINNVFA